MNADKKGFQEELRQRVAKKMALVRAAKKKPAAKPAAVPAPAKGEIESKLNEILVLLRKGKPTSVKFDSIERDANGHVKSFQVKTT